MAAMRNANVWTRGQWCGLIALMLVIGLFNAAASLSHLARAAGMLNDWPVVRYMEVDVSPDAPAGWWRVTEVTPGGAADDAGLKRGDLFSTGMIGVGPQEALAPGSRLPLSVDRDGARFQSELIVPPQPSAAGLVGTLVFGSQGLSGLVWTALGILLLLMRGRRDRAAAMLGMVLICLGWSSGGFGFVWAPVPIVFAISRVLSSLAAAGVCYFLPLAGLEISGGQLSSKQGRWVHAAAAILTVLMGGMTLAVAIPVATSTDIWAVPLILLAALLCFGTIARNYPHNDASARNRIKIVVLAFAGFLASFSLFFLFIGLGQTMRFWPLILSSALIGLAGPALITYAVLRRQLFDFSFALNRTLVYATVSFILLAGFGLAEWAVEHLVPEAWHKGSVWFSAAIGLALFLSFHRLRDWVEHHVERLLFNSWHLNEASLRRFVGASGHFEQSAALCRAFVSELQRFSGGAAAALYLRDPGGGHRLCAGKLAGSRKELAEEDRLFALLRAERRPVEIEKAQSALPGALALPMLDQGRLAGFALLDAKPDGRRYRPDEVELLGWAVHQVGLALQAQHARELEARVASMGATITKLSADRDRLEALLASAALPA